MATKTEQLCFRTDSHGLYASSLLQVHVTIDDSDDDNESPLARSKRKAGWSNKRRVKDLSVRVDQGNVTHFSVWQAVSEVCGLLSTVLCDTVLKSLY